MLGDVFKHIRQNSLLKSAAHIISYLCLQRLAIKTMAARNGVITDSSDSGSEPLERSTNLDNDDESEERTIETLGTTGTPRSSRNGRDAPTKPRKQRPSGFESSSSSESEGIQQRPSNPRRSARINPSTYCHFI